MVTAESFLMHPYGAKWPDLFHNTEFSFDEVIAYFNRPEVLQRMEDAEIHFHLPALAGAVVGLEELPSVSAFLDPEKHSIYQTVRFRRGIGVLVLVIMEGAGWKATEKSEAITKQSKYFSSSTHYEKISAM